VPSRIQEDISLVRLPAEPGLLGTAKGRMRQISRRSFAFGRLAAGKISEFSLKKDQGPAARRQDRRPADYWAERGYHWYAGHQGDNGMRNSFCLAAAVCFAALVPTTAGRAQQPAAMKIEAPEITGIQEWLNSKPLKPKDLRGKVVVLHFWTFG
jgi:hypothetical protein